MKLLFNYLTHSMKESDSVVKSKKNNGSPSKANKGVGNNKNGNTRPSTSGTDIKLNKFFKLNGDTSTGGEKPKNDKKHCNSQMNGTPKKRSNSNSNESSPSKKTSPLKSPSTPTRRKSNSLSTSASASAKKRAIERALKKKELSSASDVKRRLILEDPEFKKKKKKFLLDKEAKLSTCRQNGATKRKKPSTISPKSKRIRKRADSNCSDDSERPRPRRRASQTYFFKYQLARNPLKAEEEDLKQALLASLEQCGQQKSTSSKKQQQLLNDLLLQDQSNDTDTSSKTMKHNQRENHHQKQPRKQHPKHPPNNKQTHSKTSSLSIAQTMAPVTPATVATSTPPTYDEEYLEKYRPDTEDFLTFICFRITAPNFPSCQHATYDQEAKEITAKPRSTFTNGYSNSNDLSSITGSLNIKIEPNINVGSCKQANSSTTTSSTTDDQHNPNLRRSVSPYKIHCNLTSSIGSNQLNSPLGNRRRPPTRQSPRLANNTQQKISDSISDSNPNRAQQFQMNCDTAFNHDPIIKYEEDLKRASIALEDMAQEITKSNGIDNTISSVTTRQQNGKSSNNHNLLLSTAESIERNSHQDHSVATSIQFKNNKHLVRGLMTREFAGTFADEEIIFESISNHKL